jgi:hypothetical protein
MISERDSKYDNEPKKNYEVKVFPEKKRILLALALSSTTSAFCMMEFDASTCGATFYFHS